MPFSPTDSAAPPRIGTPAPDFQARSTLGPFRLSDHRGRWVILFAHPADFTPVCSTEFIALARAEPAFAALGCQLVGLSVDSLHAHFAWTRALEELSGQPIGFPILEDPSMVIGRAYGMIDEAAADSAAMRATFYIDPAGIVRATTCYPHDVGRSVDEMLRLLAALVAIEGEDRLAPEGWQPGTPRLLPPRPDAAGNDWFCRPEDAA